ncbi:hypothetical protein BKA65DRAFT_471878 [Rhexocercosporidium sp. MPI-PUGE-AT-0058]|nr:hypothetical protein BKA65DRAFT_471878 [Rhexocercosporidium sp. MPI-PUGE-AT-0058]
MPSLNSRLSTVILDISVCNNFDMAYKDLNPMVRHIFLTRISSWADYENAVAVGTIQDMEDLTSSIDSSDTASDFASDVGSYLGSDDERSRSSSLATEFEMDKLFSMLKASASANQEADAIAASCMPRPGLTPLAPAFAMRTASINPMAEDLKQHINAEYEKHARQRKECQEKGDIQAFIDLVIAGPAAGSENDIQRSIDDIVTAAAMKKQQEQEHMSKLLKGLHAKAIAKPEKDQTISANVPSIIVARGCSHDGKGCPSCQINPS